ncbi:MAG: hypothetical protein V3U46_08685, partial [Acidimicrobiia bacterium]
SQGDEEGKTAKHYGQVIDHPSLDLTLRSIAGNALIALFVVACSAPQASDALRAVNDFDEVVLDTV